MKEITISISQEQLNEIKDLLNISEEVCDRDVIEQFIEENCCMDKEGNSW